MKPNTMIFIKYIDLMYTHTCMYQISHTDENLSKAPSFVTMPVVDDATFDMLKPNVACKTYSGYARTDHKHKKVK